MVSPKKVKALTSKDIFNEIKRDISIIDPVSFAENNLTIDGKPFDLSGSGWKYMAEIYRSVSAQVENKEAKPIILLKGRQVGATIMAGVLSLHMASSGLFGTESGKPPIRVMHVFPDLKRCGVYAKDILANLISGAKDNYVGRRALKVARTVDLEDTQTQKNFIGMSKIRVDSIGKSGDRIRGSTQDVLLYDECFVYNTMLKTDKGKIKIGKIYEAFKNGQELPLVQTINEQTMKFEYKQVVHAWKRDPKPIYELKCGKYKAKCTKDHKFLTERGWVEAQNLKQGDFVIGWPGNKSQYLKALNDDQLQIAIGSFLGDGNLQEYATNSYRLRVLHGEKQKNYAEWKASMFGVSCKYIPEQGKYKKPGWWFATKGFGIPGHSFPKSEKKTCPQWIIDKLDWRGIAIWFMDDGSNAGSRKRSITLHTNSFDSDSADRLVEKLESMGVSCRKAMVGGKCYVIRVNKAGSQELLGNISKYLHPDLHYKTDIICDKKYAYQWNKEFKQYSYNVVSSFKSLGREEEVYDIEVKDNHNFVVTGANKKGLQDGGVQAKNCQDMTRSAIENTLKVLTATPYGAPTKGVQVFFGTPKHSGSFFWTLWEESDQRFYQLRCKHCDHYFFLYNLDNDDWNEIWIKENLIKCPSCLKTQDKREAVDLGRWMATRPTNAKGEPQKYIGYHFNMMLSPLFTKENVLEYWPQHNKNASERAWRNETKGQFYSASEVPITLEELYANALDESRGVAKSITNPAGKNFFLGMDWGEKVESDADLEVKRGKSFTCAVIVSVDHTGVLTVENAVRLKKNDPDYKMNVVRKLIADFHIDQSAADFYYGNDFVRLVQHNEGLKDKFLGCTNLSNSKRAFSYDEKDLMVGVNKDQVLDEIFALFKRGRIKIPAKGDSLELLGWLVDHITSMETHTKTKDGIVLKTYKKGVIQNDGLMALMYAYTAYKFMVTRKFTEQSAEGVNKKKQDDVVVPIVGYIPRMR
jgi:hypothetical protein